MHKNLLIIAFGLVCPLLAFGEAVDTEGNAVTNATAMGDIDMAATTVEDFKNLIVPALSSSTNSTSITNAATPQAVNLVRQAIDAKVGAAEVTNLVWNIYLSSQRYIYDATTETTYRFLADNDYLRLIAVTNVPPTPAVIQDLEE